MTTPDVINGIFEGGGSIFLWLNVRRLLQDRGYKGVYVPAIAFFAGWGIWNLYYYPHLGQWLSFTGGLSIVIANVTYVALLLKFGRTS
jgi:hypothetical protein